MSFSGFEDFSFPCNGAGAVLAACPAMKVSGIKWSLYLYFSKLYNGLQKSVCKTVNEAPTV